MRKRLFSIAFPHWPLQRLVVERPECRGRSLVLWCHDPRRGQRVLLCSPAARRCGARGGMPLSEALALGVEQAWEWDAAADQRALLQLVRFCEQFSPVVCPEEISTGSRPVAAGLLLDGTGVVDRWGSDMEMAVTVQEAIRSEGYQSRVAVADTVGAAWAMARFASERLVVVPPGETQAALEPLPVACLRLDPSTLMMLQRLGVVRVEQLLRLPRAGLATRLGPHVLRRLDQALGTLEEPLETPAVEPIWKAQWQLEHPTVRQEVLEQGVQHLSQHLSQSLRERELGAIQIVCRLESEPLLNSQGERTAPWTWEFAVNFFRPTADAAHWWMLLRTPLDNQRWQAPIQRLQLWATSTARLPRQQRMLWNEWNEVRESEASHELAELIDRLSQRLGTDQVCAVRLRANTLPEDAYVALPLTGPQASAARLAAPSSRRPFAPAHRPLHLLPIPIRLMQMEIAASGMPGRFQLPHRSAETTSSPSQAMTTGVHRGGSWALPDLVQVSRAWGPERMETRWWRAIMVQRDYFRVEVEEGYRYWLFCDLTNQQWFLHGYFS